MWDLVLLRRIVVCKRTVVSFVTYIYIILFCFQKQEAECIRTPPRNSLSFSTAHRTRSHSLKLRNLRSNSLNYVVQNVHLLKLLAKIEKKTENEKRKTKNFVVFLRNYIV